MKQQFGRLYIIIVLVLIFYIGGSSFLFSRLILFGIGSFLLALHFLSGRSFNKKIVFLLFIWIVINMLSMIFLGSGFILYRIIIMTINLILLPYVLLKGTGAGFWKKFEQIIFMLTVISIPLYLLNIVFNEDFNKLTSFFEPVTNKSLAVNENYWSALIYINATGDNYYGLIRNSGFMWEPGGFAMIIVYSIVFNWLTKGANLNRRIIIYFIALITTFSTAGYFSMFLLISAYYIKRVSFFNITFLLASVAIFYLYIYKLDFISGKIDKYTVAYKEGNVNVQSGQEIKVNRFQGGYYALLKTLKYPLGYGLVSEKDFTDELEIYGTNGLGSLLTMWGIPAFIFLIYLFWQFLKVFNLFNVNRLTLTFLFLALMVMFFSNPIARSVFIYLIIISPIAFEKNEIEKYFLSGNQLYRQSHNIPRI